MTIEELIAAWRSGEMETSRGLVEAIARAYEDKCQEYAELEVYATGANERAAALASDMAAVLRAVRETKGGGAA